MTDPTNPTTRDHTHLHSIVAPLGSPHFPTDADRGAFGRELDALTERALNDGNFASIILTVARRLEVAAISGRSAADLASLREAVRQAGGVLPPLSILSSRREPGYTPERVTVQLTRQALHREEELLSEAAMLHSARLRAAEDAANPDTDRQDRPE